MPKEDRKYEAVCLCFFNSDYKTRTIAVLILYTIKSVSIFSILLLHVSFGIDRENSCNNQSSKVGNHFLYSYDVKKLFSSIIVRRNWTLVTLRV